MTRTRPVVLAASLALVACSAMVDPDKIAPVGPAIDQLCAQIGPILVGKAVACTHSPEAWIRQSDILPNCGNWPKSVSAGRIVYDAAKAQQCLDALTAATCQETFGDTGGPPSVCFQALQGQVQDGASCWDDSDCRIDSFCDHSNCPGTCKRRSGLNQACGSTGECQAGLACQNNPIAVGKVCMTILSQGAICTAPGTVCGPGLYCDASTTGQCVFQRTGGPCTRWEECLGPEYVCAGLVLSAPPVTGQCSPVSRVNQPCVVGYHLCPGGPLPGGTWCKSATSTQVYGDAGTCVLYNGVPNACGDFGGGEIALCYGGYCGVAAAPACADWFPDGASCLGYGDAVCLPGTRCQLVAGTGPYCNVCTAP
jgi:hypothetical protein